MKNIGRFIFEREVERSQHLIKAVVMDSGTSRKYMLSRYQTSNEESTIGKREFHNEQMEKTLSLRRKYANPRIKRAEQIYGLHENRYLINLSEPYKPIGAWLIIDLINKCRSDDLHLFGVWESIALQMMSEAHQVDGKQMNKQIWHNRWSKLSGGKILTEAIADYLENGELSRTEKFRILERVSVKQYSEPEFAENLLLRIIGAFTRNKMSPEGAIATILCEHFQRNVTLHEKAQIKAAIAAMKEAFFPEQLEIKWLELVLTLCTNKPMSINESQDHFVKIETTKFPQFDIYLESMD